MVFVGNHFGTRVIKNHLLGRGRLLQAHRLPDRDPRRLGMVARSFSGRRDRGQHSRGSRDGRLAGSRAFPAQQDQQGANLHDDRAQSQRHALVGGVLEPARHSSRDKPLPPPLTLGYAPSHDPGEFVVTAAGNRFEAPAGAQKRRRALDPCRPVQFATRDQPQDSSCPPKTNRPADGNKSRSAGSSPKTRGTSDGSGDC